MEQLIANKRIFNIKLFLNPSISFRYSFIYRSRVRETNSIAWSGISKPFSNVRLHDSRLFSVILFLSGGGRPSLSAPFQTLFFRRVSISFSETSQRANRFFFPRFDATSSRLVKACNLDFITKVAVNALRNSLPHRAFRFFRSLFFSFY